MLIGYYNYFADHPESFKFDKAKGDYILQEGATDEAKAKYKKYKELEEWAKLEGIHF